MYRFYLKNYKDQNGSIQTGETLMYEVPISDPSLALTSPTVTTEMGKAGSCEASVKPDQIWYNCWLQMKTLIRVEYDGTTIFRGRALTIDNTLIGDKKLHFEGDLAFLLDSMAEPIKEGDRGTITLGNYVAYLLAGHNDQMREQGNTDKIIELGEIPGFYSGSISTAMRIQNDSQKFGSDGWQTTMDCLEELQGQYGGYFRTRYEDGHCYLDWLDSWFREGVNDQIIEIGENLVDMNSSAEVENIFTALIPIGRNEGNDVYIDGYRTDLNGANNKRILVPTIVHCFSEQDLSWGYHTPNDYATAVQKYGIIYKTQKFENADTKEKLWNYAVDWIRTNYVGGIVSFSLTAVDLHHLDEEIPKYLAGDQVRLRYPDIDNRVNGVTPKVTRTLTMVSVTYNPHNPESNSYSLGTPNNILTKTYGSPVTKTQPTQTASTTPTTSTSKSSASGTAAAQQKQQETTHYNSSNYEEEAERDFWLFLMDDKHNTKEYKYYKDQYGDKAAEGALRTSYMILDNGANKKKEDEKEYLRSILINGHAGEFSFHYTRDPESGVDYDKLENFQAATNTMSFNARGELTLKERLDLIMDIDPETGLFKLPAPLWQLNLKEDGTGALNKAWTVDKNDPTQKQTLLSYVADTARGQLLTVNAVFGTVGDEITKIANGEKEGNVIIDGAEKFLGLTSDGNDITAFVNGITGAINLFDPITKGKKAAIDAAGGLFKFFTGTGSGTDSDTTFEIDGKTGEVKAGRDSGTGDWLTTLRGGLVTAKDFAISQKYDSVAAELGKFDTLIANKIDASEIYANYLSAAEIEADYAKIADLVASNILVTDDPDHSTVLAWLTENGEDISALSGLVADKITAYEGRFHTIETDYLKTDNLLTTIANVTAAVTSGSFHANNYVTVGNGTYGAVYSPDFYFGDSENSRSLKNGVLAVRVVPDGNNYRLEYATWNTTGDDWTSGGTFSRATSLEGTWGSGSNLGTYTVRATPQNEVISTKIYPTVAQSGTAQYYTSAGNHYVKQTKILYAEDPDNPGDAGSKIFEREISILANDAYEAGMGDAALTDVTGVWDGLTYKVTGKIGTQAPSLIASTKIYDGIVPYGTSEHIVSGSNHYAKQTFIVYSDDGEGNADQEIMSKELSILANDVYRSGNLSVGIGNGSWSQHGSNGGRFSVSTTNRITNLSTETDIAVFKDGDSYGFDASRKTLKQDFKAIMYDEYGEEDGNAFTGTLTVDAASAFEEGNTAGYITGYNENKSAYLSIGNTDLNPGESVTVYARYLDYDGNWHNSGDQATIRATGSAARELSTGWTKSGDPSWESDYSGVSQDIIVSYADDGSTAVVLDDVWFDTSGAVNYGKNSIGLTGGYWDGNGTYTVKTTGKNVNLERSTTISVSTDGEMYQYSGLLAFQPYKVEDDTGDLAKDGNILVNLGDLIEAVSVYPIGSVTAVAPCLSKNIFAVTQVGDLVSTGSYKMSAYNLQGEAVYDYAWVEDTITTQGSPVYFRSLLYTGYIYDGSGNRLGYGEVYFKVSGTGDQVHTYYNKGSEITRYKKGDVNVHYQRGDSKALYTRQEGTSAYARGTIKTGYNYPDTADIVSLYSSGPKTTYYQFK